MRSYLDACQVPTTLVGGVELPRLIMGIHPYDGCSYVDPERDTENLTRFGRVGGVAEVIRFVAEQGVTAVQVDHMLPVLDRLHLQAVWEAEQQAEIEIGLVAYILVPVTFAGEEIGWSDRAYATFFAENERVGGEAFLEHMKKDEILRYNLGGSYDAMVTPEKVRTYTAEDAAKFEIDYGRLEQYLGFFAGCEILVADPGAEIDILAMTGRFDLIREYLAFLRGRFGTVITSVHHAGVTIPLLEQEGIPVDGYLTPVNQLGYAMTPTRDIALDAIRQATKPVIGIKPMAGGRYLGHQAFEFAFSEAKLAACMYGLGTLEQARETTQAAKEVLGAI